MRRDKPDQVRLALAMGADIRWRGEGSLGELPLHLASDHGTSHCLHLLIGAGLGPGDIDARDRSGRTALFLASFDRPKQYGGCKALGPDLSQLPIFLLLALGADPRARDLDGNTPLHVAARADFLIAAEALLAAGADPRAQNLKGETPLASAEKLLSPAMRQLLQAREDALDLSEATPHPLDAPPRARPGI